MEVEYKKEKGSFILKKLESYLSKNRHKKSSSSSSKKDQKPTPKQLMAPSGCFSVYVGHEKHRFVIKTEFLNHPSFKILLDEAEMEYGFSSEGPLLIPCGLDLFCRILAEMDCERDWNDDKYSTTYGYGLCSPCNLARRLGKRDTIKGLLKINHF